MVFDTWIYGELELPAERFSRWLSQPLGPEGHGPDFVADDTGCVGREPLVILEALHQLMLSPREFLGIAADTGRIEVRGLLGDKALLKSQGLLTALFASAVGHGGDGRLVVAGRRGTTFGYEVHVCCGVVRARALDETERRAFLDSRACAELGVRERENLKQLLDMANPGPTAPRPPPAPVELKSEPGFTAARAPTL